MNIKRVVFAFMVVAVTFGCASTMDTESQKTAQDTDTVQGTDTVQDTDTVEGADTVQAADSEAYDPDEVTCKRIAKTGTRFKSKVCATNAEWKASEEYAQKATADMQQKPQPGRGSQ
ncbi:MAG: hypothetical protein ACR2RD_16625 [Woeseiaceae bacterium]